MWANLPGTVKTSTPCRANFTTAVVSSQICHTGTSTILSMYWPVGSQLCSVPFALRGHVCHHKHVHGLLDCLALVPSSNGFPAPGLLHGRGVRDARVHAVQLQLVLVLVGKTRLPLGAIRISLPLGGWCSNYTVLLNPLLWNLDGHAYRQMRILTLMNLHRFL